MKQVLQLTSLNSLSMHFFKKKANYSTIGILTDAILMEIKFFRHYGSFKLFEQLLQ